MGRMSNGAERLHRQLIGGAVVALVVWLFIVVCLVRSASADGVLTGNFGVGIEMWSDKVSEAPNEGKHVGLTWSDGLPWLPKEFIYEVGGGLFFPDNFGNSNPTALLHLGLGAEVVIPSGLYFRAIMGPAWISKTDDRLGSKLQFIAKVGLGFEAKSGVRIGPYYQHLSNGAVSKGANLGRDWVGIEIGFRF